MSNRKTRLLACSLVPLLAIAVLAKQPEASSNGIAQRASKVKAGDQAVLSKTNRLMTHLALATQALDAKDEATASRNLGDAKLLVGLMEKDRPEIAESYQYVYGKTKIREETVEKDYYFPVADDLQVQQIYTENVRRGQPLMKVVGSDIVETNLQLNLKSVGRAIDAAQGKLKVGNLVAARSALAGITKDALSSEVVLTDPLLKIWGDLHLAENFLTQKELPSARFALEAATVALRRLETDKVLQKSSADAKALSLEIDQMKAELRTATTSPQLEKMLARLHDWEHKLKSWI